jgi:hypothetical protein
MIYLNYFVLNMFLINFAMQVFNLRDEEGTEVPSFYC